MEKIKSGDFLSESEQERLTREDMARTNQIMEIHSQMLVAGELANLAPKLSDKQLREFKSYIKNAQSAVIMEETKRGLDKGK